MPTLLKLPFFAALASATLLFPQVCVGEFLQQGPKLVGTDAVGVVEQGISVSISADGNTALVGAASGVATAYVFVRVGGAWTQQGPRLAADGMTSQSMYQSAVALSADGNTAIIGQEYDDNATGAAWVFTRTSGVWSQQGPKLVGTGAIGQAHQGHSVALSSDGNTAVVGGQGDNINANTGAVWIFVRDGGAWSQQGPKLVGTGGAGATGQGSSVSISADGNSIIVGGNLDNHFLGAAWIFTRSAGVWTQDGGKLVGTGTQGQDSNQGVSVAMSGDGNTAIVGGLSDNSFQGAAWIFAHAGGTWTQQGSKLVGSGAIGAAFQGIGVGISGDGNTAIVGGDADNSDVGAAWIFSRTGGVWSQQGSKLVGAGWMGSPQQGVSVSISSDGSTVILGAFGDDTINVTGASWIFASTPTTNLVYKSLDPCRVMDTRYASEGSGVHGPILGNVLYQIPGLLAPSQNWGTYGGTQTTDCGLANPPGNAIHALALVITILDPNYDSYLGAGDVGDLTTTLSTVALNFTHGQGLSTMYVVPQLTNNVVYFALPEGLSAHIVMDLIGYFVVSDATALECTTQRVGPVPNGLGVLGVITPACPFGYTLVSGSCDSTTTNFRLSQHKAYYGNTAWNCYGFNTGPGPVALTGTANCCRVPGR